jgi:hypothetical protein
MAELKLGVDPLTVATHYRVSSTAM